MRTYDLSSLWRSTIGFDHLFSLLDDAARWSDDDQHYPPYNIERTGEDHYQIALALAGFAPADIAITAEQNVLNVEGSKADKGERQYLYQGISARPFKRVFKLADHVQVTGASFRERTAQDRSCARGAGGDEAPAYCHQRQRRSADRRSQKSGVEVRTSKRKGRTGRDRRCAPNSDTGARAMPITPFLRNQAFEPEALDAMSLAFTNACKALGLSDRSDKLTEIVAHHVIEWAQRGVLDPIELTAATLRGIKAE